MRASIKHKYYEIEYFVYGSGEKILFAFHGFNNHAEDFEVLAQYPGNQYTIVSMNIFFHGESRAHEVLVEKGFSIDDLKELFNEMSALFKADKYTLMGYSLGGRLVLKMLETFPEKIEKIILLAPDGIRMSLFYKFLTRTNYGRWLLKRVIDRPNFVFLVFRMIRKMRLVSEKKYQFAMNNFGTMEKREKVYLVWMTLRKIISKKSSIMEILKRYPIHIYLFFGKHDQIIPPSVGRGFQKGMEEYVTLNILEAGHRLLKEKPLLEVAKYMHTGQF